MTGCDLLDFGMPARQNGKRLPCERLMAENTKLRELCKRFAEYVSQDRCEGCVCKRRCDNGEIDECWQRAAIRDAAHELGIEVPGGEA